MDPVIVINIYVNQDGTASVAGAPHVVLAQGASGGSPGPDIPPPPSADPTEAAAAVDGLPSPPVLPSDQDVTPPPPPSLPSDAGGQDVPPPPVADVEPGGAPDIPPPPDA